jgi:hypothetical protein
LAATWTSEKDEKDDTKFRNHLGASLFPKPGRYFVKVRYYLKGKKEQYVEKVAPIEIEEPKTDDDKKVCELLRQNQRLATVMMSAGHVPEIHVKDVIAALSDLTEKFPKSSYAPYAEFAIARRYARGPVFKEMSQNQALAVAVGYLGEIRSKRFAYQPNARLLEVSCLATLGEKEKVAKLVDELKSKFPDSLECLGGVAGSMKAEEWKVFRKRVPKDD